MLKVVPLKGAQADADWLGELQELFGAPARNVAMTQVGGIAMTGCRGADPLH